MRKIEKIRYILNLLFLIGAVVTVVLYVVSGQGSAFFYTGVVTLSIKMVEFILRFI